MRTKLIVFLSLLCGGLALYQQRPDVVYTEVQTSGGIVDVTKLREPIYTAKGFAERTLDNAQDAAASAFISEAIAAGHTVDVTARGAKGDGSTVDTAAFQRAVDGLVSTGGVVWVPPDRKYVIGSGTTGVLVKSRFPIYIVSAMNNDSGYHGNQVTAGTAKACIVPGSGFTGSMFTWDFVSGETNLSNAGGGGMNGLRFVDWNGSTYRNVTGLVSVVYMKQAGYFSIENCDFCGLSASAIKVDETTIGRIDFCKFIRCGATSKPTWLLGDGTNFYGVYSESCFLEQCAGDYSIHLKAAGGMTAHRLYIENGEQVFTSDPIAIQGDGEFVLTDYSVANNNIHFVCNQKVWIHNGRHFATWGSDLPFISIAAGDPSHSMFSNLYLLGTTGQDTEAIDCQANNCSFENIKMKFCGTMNLAGSDCRLTGFDMETPLCTSGFCLFVGPNSIASSGVIDGATLTAVPGVGLSSRAQANGILVRRLDNQIGFFCSDGNQVISGCQAYDLNGGTGFDVGSAALWGCNGDDSGASYKTRLTASIVPPLTAFVETDGTNDPLAAASNGGVLASDTTPILRADANGNFEIVWAAGNQDAITIAIPVPADLDDTANMLFDVTVYTDNAGGGGIEAATFAFATSFDGAAEFVDAATDASPATTLHTNTATIAASDVPSGAKTMTIRISPATHANDPVVLCGFKIRYTQLLTAAAKL